jgi:ABC-type multidrug transport system permease subunit
MIPARFAPILFGLILSGLMSFLVSGISTFRSTGEHQVFFGAYEIFFQQWMGAWGYSWAVAFPTVLVVAPITRRLVATLVKSE